ncbi:hypothetical protein BHE74_00004271 [Ensete ventricosum]|nr:hypothetical protein BHE74_00004271 [Ensete ventricosum]
MVPVSVSIHTDVSKMKEKTKAQWRKRRKKEEEDKGGRRKRKEEEEEGVRIRRKRQGRKRKKKEQDEKVEEEGKRGSDGGGESIPGSCHLHPHVHLLQPIPLLPLPSSPSPAAADPSAAAADSPVIYCSRPLRCYRHLYLLQWICLSSLTANANSSTCRSLLP